MERNSQKKAAVVWVEFAMTVVVVVDSFGWISVDPEKGSMPLIYGHAAIAC
jgi:hypothetical protein